LTTVTISSATATALGSTSPETAIFFFGKTVNTVLPIILCWTAVSGITDTTSIRGAGYGNGKWVAIGLPNNPMHVSADNGVTWNPIAGGPPFTIGYKVAYGNGKWVAVGKGPSNMYTSSNDAVTWSPVTGVFEGPDYYGAGVAYANGIWVAIGTGVNQIVTSTDAITWTPATGGFINGSYVQDVAFGNGKWVAVGFGRDDNDHDMYTSIDNGSNWTLVPSTFPFSGGDATSGGGIAVTYANNRWVAVGRGGSGGRMITSTDAINWTLVTGNFNGISGSSGGGIAYGNGKWVVVGEGPLGQTIVGMYVSSDDTATWVPSTGVFNSNYRIQGVEFASDTNTWLVFGNIPARIYRATDPTCVA
jgi:hypothetical protein